MLPKSVRNSLVALPLLLSLAGCLPTIHIIRPPEPEQLPAIPHPPVPETDSSIRVPVHVDLSTFLDTANDENVIPKKFDHWGAYINTSKGAEYKYYAERDDFAMDLSGSQQSISTDHEPTLRNWWKGVEPPGSYLSISTALRYKIGTDPHIVQCGEGNDWPRSATLNGRIAIGLTPNYGLSASVTGVTVNAIDPCKISIADTDVIQEVHNRLTKVVQGGVDDAVARINAMTVKSHAEDAWNALRKPIQLEPDTWLLLNIDKMRHSGFSGAGHVIDDTMHITANPVVVFGAEPPSASAALPPLDTQPPSSGFHAVTDVQLEYATLSRALARRLKGKFVQIRDEKIVITNASIFGHGGNQLVLRIDFTGEAQGHVYLVGKPEINALTQTISFSGLRYDPATDNLLKTAPDWFNRYALRDLIASEAFLEATPAINRVRDLLTIGLNRTLSPDISMHGTVASVQGIAVFADVNALYVRAMSDGTLSLKVVDKH
jgi:hypothetical protein